MNAMCLFPCRKSRMSFWNQGRYIEHEGTFFGTFWTAGKKFKKRSPGPGGGFVVPDNLSVGNLRNQVHWLWDWCLDWTSFLLYALATWTLTLSSFARVSSPMVDCQLYWKKTWGTASKAAYDAVDPRWFVLWLWAVPWSSTSSVPGKP